MAVPTSVELQPAMLALARAAKGYTQMQLAKRSGISQGLLSRVENGAVELDGERVRAVADALGVPEALLRHAAPTEDGLSACAFHRKRNALPVWKAKQVRAQLDLTGIQEASLVAGRLPAIGLKPSPPSADGYITPKDIARSTRQHLNVPAGPIIDLVGLIERAGVLVTARDLGTRHLDAISCWPPGGRPMVLLNSEAPGERQRFTLAHELGHAIMHAELQAADESEADQFASEFLMPAAEIRAELQNLTTARLLRLKQRWGVSMAAMTRRARDLGTISDYRYKQLNIEFSKAGYRTREPEPIEGERPRLVAMIVAERLAAGEPIKLLSDLAYMSVEDFAAEFVGGTR